jgi:Ca-activated chloride channel family protein
MDLGIVYILRPWALLLFLPVIAFIWWFFHNQDERKKWQKLVAPEFLPYLLVKQNSNAASFSPFWFIALVLLLMVIVLAGPSWQYKPSPFKNDTVKMVFVVKNTPSMQAEDLKPRRLTRGVFKIDDLLKLRPKLRSGLVAYSGSAQEVLPITTDSRIIISFARALDPSVMPVQGDNLPAAVAKAATMLKQEGTIVILADTITKDQISKIAADTSLKDCRLLFFVIMPPAMADKNLYADARRKLSADIVYFADDDSDVKSISAVISHNFKALNDKKANRRDNGYVFLFPIGLIMLFWFRKGFLAEAWRIS